MVRDKHSRKISKTSEFKIRTSKITDEIGAVLKSDFRQNLWKLYPVVMISPVPGLMTGIFMALTLGTLGYKIASKTVRQKFKDAVANPIDLELYESALRQNPKTGEYYISLPSMFNRRAKLLQMHLGHLARLRFTTMPDCQLKRGLAKFGKKATKQKAVTPFSYMDLGMTQHRQDNGSKNRQSTHKTSARRSFRFSLFPLRDATPNQIANYLCPIDRERFALDSMAAFP